MTAARRSQLALVLVAVLCAVLIPLVASAQTSTTSSLIVKLIPGLTADQQAAVIARNGGTETSSIPALRLHVIAVPTADLETVRASYAADSQVVSVEDNKSRQSETIPADALYSSQWALPKIGWETVFGTVTPTGIAKVFVLDTGIDALHPDLAGKVLPGKSMLDSSDATTDPSGHGTWLAGIIAANTNTSEGIAGVGYEGVKVVPVRVLDANGLGQDSDVIAGVLWAADNGADVILMAFSNPGFSQNLQDAIDYAWSKGIVLVAAVGNNAVSTATFPAGDRGVMGVAATDQGDLQAYFSNEGQSVFIAAPGIEIPTTDIGSAYSTITGTSSSAAIVAGVAAFMKAMDPSLSNGVIVGRIARNADPAGTQVQTGNGRVNMERALADTSTESVQPAGADPVGAGGPFVGPYQAAASGDGAGTMLVATSPSAPLNGNSTATLTFTFTASNNLSDTDGAGTNVNPAVRLTIPAGWSLPTLVSGNPGFVSVANGSPSCNAGSPTVSGSTITVPMNCPNTGKLIITYAGAVTPAPASSTTYTFQAQSRGNASLPGPPTPAFANLTSGSPTVQVSGIQSQTITFDALANKTFGDPDFGITATASSGLTVSFSSQTTSKCTVSGSTVHLVAVGTCTIRASQAGNASFSPAADVDQSFTINKAPVTATAGSGSGTYNGSTQTPSACAVTGAYTGNLTCANNPASVGPDFGTTTIVPVVSGTGLANFDITPVNGSYTINKAPVTATAGSGSGTYNGSTQTPSTCVVTGAYTGNLTCANNPTSVGPDIGTTPILPVVSGTGLANFDITPVNGSYTINKAPVTATAGSGSGTYSGSTQTPSACVVTGAYTGNLTCANNPTSVGPDFGTTTILPVVSGAHLSNFDITPVNGSYTINKAPVTATAGSGSGTYNGSTQTPSACVVTGAYTGNLTCANNPTSVGPNIGTTPILPVVSGTGLTNFDITPVNGSYTINRAPVMATAGSGSGIFNGSTQTPSACTVTGVYIGSLSCANNPASVGPAVGTTTITPVVSGPGLTNFDITPVNGSYTIGAWTPQGFYEPIGIPTSIYAAPGVSAPLPNTSTVWNSAKGGSTIPLKFNIFAGSVEKTSTSDVGSFSAMRLSSCSTSAEDQVEEFATTGGTSLRYDTTGHQFIQNWKTTNVTREECYRASVTFADGTTIYTFVKLKK
jgi:hypothetical protein